MMRLRGLDWVDIGLHCAAALVWGAGCGFGVQLGVAYLVDAPTTGDWWLGLAMIIVCAAATIAGILFWVSRERLQHGYDFGGRQSTWEWLAPGLVCAASCALTAIFLPMI